jgi:hypothetical protein
MHRDLDPSESMTQHKDLSIWSQKPWWCQPWSIVLTGVAVVSISWLLFGRWWLSLVVAVGVSLWWGLFLVLVPAAWRQEAQAAADLAPPGVSAGPVIASTKPE